MSLESALDEERREVLALLEGRPKRPAPVSSPSRASSPAAAKSPIRSMLDITSPPPPPVQHRSMLDIGPPTSGSKSPARSPASSSPPLPRATPVSTTRKPLNPEEAYKFEMLPSIQAHALPKRVAQGGKKKKGAIASVFGSSDNSSRARSRSGQFQGGRKSMSPGARSQSPPKHLNLMRDPNKYYSDSGKAIDMSHAYRRLSDAAILRHGGSLAALPPRKGSDPEKGEMLAPDGGIRLQMDYDPDEDEEEAVESSDSSDDDGANKKRGRRRTRDDSTGSAAGLEAKAKSLNIDGKRPATSLMGAAEQERKETAYTYRSLLDDPPMAAEEGSLAYITQANKRPGVHPATNFDENSTFSTPVTSDDEGALDDIRRAEQLEITATIIKSTPENNRCVREIFRGEYDRLRKDAQAGLRRQRVYLVATDLSDEAEYALEWTIGTVLRDGDTLLAVYAMDEETVGAAAETSGDKSDKPDHTSPNDPNGLIRTLSNDTTGSTGLAVGAYSLSRGPSPLSNVTSANDAKKDISPAPSARSEPEFASMDKAEKERWHATMEISDRCIKLLQKTRLQVRILVEVFHCKNPKHMITEVIDYLEPTLVVLGSRGRGALKGVLLGSFSNYLVTKSSVPVMVARKRLRKHSKYQRTNMRFSNVLTNPSGKLATAKID